MLVHGEQMCSSGVKVVVFFWFMSDQLSSLLCLFRHESKAGEEDAKKEEIETAFSSFKNCLTLGRPSTLKSMGRTMANCVELL